MKVKNIPVVSLNDIDKKTYIKSLANAERYISQYKNIARVGINNIIKNRFGVENGAFDVFDKRAGGILFKDWEWEQIPNEDLIKQLFETKENRKYKYCLETDEGRILRGADTYYYFLTNKGKSKNVSPDLVTQWAKNNSDFLSESAKILRNYKITNNSDRRLVLGILDNIRNVSLITLNAQISSIFQNENIVLQLSTYMKNLDISKWYNICSSTYDCINELCFNKFIDGVCMNNINELIMNILDVYENDVQILLKNDTTVLNKSFRSYREIDNYIENYIAMSYAINEIKQKNPQILNREINFIGIAYGGLELPFIAKDILNGEALTSAVMMTSKYGARRAQDYIDADLKIESEIDLKSSFNVLSDDNVLTGKTLQSIINMLFSNEIALDNIGIVRYPSISRVNQMIAENAAIDTSKFFNYIEGLVFSSPYTKIKTDTGGQYLDELGIFNKDRRRLLEYLYKNGQFLENSEVGEISGLYKKKGLLLND